MNSDKSLLICSVMPSIVRPLFHIRETPLGGRNSKGNTLCGLPYEYDYHFGLRAWGQLEMGTWCKKCYKMVEDK